MKKYILLERLELTALGIARNTKKREYKFFSFAVNSTLLKYYYFF